MGWPAGTPALEMTRDQNIGMHYPNTNIGTIRTYLAEQGRTCIHLGPGTPTSDGGWNPKVIIRSLGEGIVLSHAWLVGKGLDSAVP